MQGLMKKWVIQVRRYMRWRFSDEGFLSGTKRFESVVSKLLSVTMLVVIIVIMVDLIGYLATMLLTPDPAGFFTDTLGKVFGVFLSVLIALEILENITAYLRKHAIQLELVIVTSLTAIARKIIILDLEKITGLSVIGLGVAVLALSISYWIVRSLHR